MVVDRGCARRWCMHGTGIGLMWSRQCERQRKRKVVKVIDAAVTLVLALRGTASFLHSEKELSGGDRCKLPVRSEDPTRLELL